jgi:hypothetical protein
MPELDRPAVDPGLHRAEYPELRRQLTSAHPSPTVVTRRFKKSTRTGDSLPCFVQGPPTTIDLVAGERSPSPGYAKRYGGIGT